MRLPTGPITIRRDQAPEYLAMLEASARPRSGNHVTDCIGCPRRRALQREGVPQDLPRLKAVSFGSLMHRGIGTQEVGVLLQLGGHKLIGSMDRVDRDANGLVVADYKCPNADSFVWGVKANGFPKPEHVWQIEAYRLALQQRGEQTRGGRIIYMAHTSRKWPATVEALWESPIVSEADLLAFTPFEGPWSVAAIMAYFDAPADNIPLIGATWPMGKDKTSCDYCEVELTCKLRASVAPAKEAF